MEPTTVSLSHASDDSNSLQVLLNFNENANDEDFNQLLNDKEIENFPAFIERLIIESNVNFPKIMDFLLLKNIVTKKELCEIYKNIGFTIVSEAIISDPLLRLQLLQTLTYLNHYDCDLNLELLNFLQSLAFGGKFIKHGSFEINVQIIHLLLPFCTNFFHDENYWNKIRYFYHDTKEVIDAMVYLITNFGTESSVKFISSPTHRNAFSLKHLARNKVREILFYRKSKFNCDVTRYCELCKINLPAVTFKYLYFILD